MDGVLSQAQGTSSWLDRNEGRKANKTRQLEKTLRQVREEKEGGLGCRKMFVDGRVEIERLGPEHSQGCRCSQSRHSAKQASSARPIHAG